MSAMGDRAVRRLLVLVVLLLAGGVAALGVGVDDRDGGDVVRYLAGGPGRVLVARDGGFRVEFPTAPRRRAQTVDAKGVEISVVDYTGGTDDHAFTVSFAEIPPGQEVGDPVARLQASATGAAEAVDGKLEASTVTEFAGLPAVEYLISADGRFIKVTSFLSGRRLFGVQVVGRQNPPGGYDRFRSTFRLG